MDTLEHPDIVALLDAITHDNWFDQLHPLADRFLELGDQEKYDRCIDLIMARKRPTRFGDVYVASAKRGMWVFIHSVGYLGYDQWSVEEWCLPSSTVSFIDTKNNGRGSTTIQPQLTGYLQVPEELRIVRAS